jgi:hypothetical protein
VHSTSNHFSKAVVVIKRSSVLRLLANPLFDVTPKISKHSEKLCLKCVTICDNCEKRAASGLQAGAKVPAVGCT